MKVMKKKGRENTGFKKVLNAKNVNLFKAVQEERMELDI
jgi:hypothetical protein